MIDYRKCGKISLIIIVSYILLSYVYYYSNFFKFTDSTHVANLNKIKKLDEIKNNLFETKQEEVTNDFTEAIKKEEIKNNLVETKQQKEIILDPILIERKKAIEIVNSPNLYFKIRSIYAVVFFGRKKHLSILLKYLEPNMKANGGILDKVLFAVKTSNKEDLEYLDFLKYQNKSYIEWRQFTANKAYGEVYHALHDDDLVFKIDDDVCFISNGTFDRMTYEYLSKQLLFLSANVVNHPLLSYVHARLRAIIPFRIINDTVFEKYTDETEIDSLFGDYSYDAFSKWWSDPKAAATAHMSLIHHIKNNNVDAYNFKIWDFHAARYTRWSINFFLTRGKHVNKIRELYPNLDDDELLISERIPSARKKHCYSLGSAVVAHFSYYTQREYLEKTNLLSKYDDIAKFYLKLN